MSPGILSFGGVPMSPTRTMNLLNAYPSLYPPASLNFAGQEALRDWRLFMVLKYLVVGGTGELRAVDGIPYAGLEH